MSQIITYVDAYQLADRLLKEQNLNVWRFEVNNRSNRRLGMCSYRKKTIQLSSWVLDRCPHYAENTIRHEVAHALVGPGNGHGQVWKRAAKQMGARPETCTNVPLDLRAPYKWMLECPRCLWVGGGSYRKRSSSYRCLKCKARLENKKV